MSTCRKHARLFLPRKLQWLYGFRAISCENPKLFAATTRLTLILSSYGVSRVYSEQCAYVLMDAQSTQSTMKAFLKIVKHAELDPDAGKSR